MRPSAMCGILFFFFYTKESIAFMQCERTRRPFAARLTFALTKIMNMKKKKQNREQKMLARKRSSG